ncbi:acyltransferase [Flavobacterium cerinum]|uniref:Transferase n=1 Tax=Flavobacterium cerinum TaxID=2502784 RepID=A0A444GM20_9FLAO|nr:transferase [Flavobacterium cerinum]RWW92085.1 transferase [Flavobacterium cerinum]
MYTLFRKIYRKRKLYYKVNWIKTIYFNLKAFPFSMAKKLPVYIYGRVKLQNINGNIKIEAPIKPGMIGFGQPFELNSVHRGTAELVIQGEMVFKGHVQFGKDYFIYVAKDAYIEFGHMSSLASNGKIICRHKIVLGDYTRIGSESQLIDTNFHQMIDSITGEKFVLQAPIVLGSYNYISNRVSVMLDTKTPSYCTIASNTLCNKDYTALGQNILIGGIPAKLLKSNITRDWKTEKELLDQWLIV